LAHMDPVRRNYLMNSMQLARVTAATVTEKSKLDAMLDEVRTVGYAFDDEEHALGLRCVAAPLFDEHGQGVAAVSISGPSARIPLERLSTLGRMVAQAASEATRDYGGALPVAAQ
ncbi:MAG: IclR family transcriptional regulator C-terminal domain-containing protein, partial [Pseudomonadota bacterium]